jgi:hypothetical protein
MAGARKARAKETTLSQELSGLLAKTVVPSLRRRVEESGDVRAMLAELLADERKAGLTSDDEIAFRERFIEQIGASWVLATVFVRYLEDRGWLAQRRIAGPGAEDSEDRFGQAFESLAGDAREYLLAVFRECGRLPGAREVLGPNVLAALKLSPDAACARAILEFWRHQVKEQGEDGVERTALRWRFDTDDTRVLGDLYQDLSENVRERYALLQTPDFVERFILDYTLVPAIEQHGVDAVRLLDPTCGSGHFLLGAFECVRAERQRRFPSESAKESALRALACVHGVDLNPYAVAITRFRLLVAYAKAAGIERLSEVGSDGLGLDQRVIVADSLLFGTGSKVDRELVEAKPTHEVAAGFGRARFALDDAEAAAALFSKSFHVVVGNPPYITCKDATLRETYRKRYPESASGKYALAAPFTERFFNLAARDGFVGLINANSFMKREFGKGLIEKVLKRLDVTHVIDTSGAFIPGHGTPTVILFGRNRPPHFDTVRAVLGKRGEPSTPERAEEGQVWTSITGLIEKPGGESEYVSVVDAKRATFEKHPWSLGGGGAGDLKELIEQKCEKRLGDLAEHVGIAAVTGEDDLYMQPRAALVRQRVESSRAMVTGEIVRDWSVADGEWTIFPCDAELNVVDIQSLPETLRMLWPYRSNISLRRRFGTPMIQKGAKWWELQELYRDKLRTPLSITFAEVATHNHFVLDRGGNVFKQSAPIIKLTEGATEEEHLALLAWLNSSTACFWMKQVFQAKASAVADVSIEKGKAESNRYQFAGTGMRDMPLPPQVLVDGAHRRLLIEYSSAIMARAESKTSVAPREALARWTPSEGALSDCLASAAREERRLANEMIALQEELDWFVYSLLALSDAPKSLASSLASDQRPFCCDVAASGVDAREFARRRAEIATNASIRLIEDVNYKRGWSGRRGVFGMHVLSDDELRSNACADWLADEIESKVRASAEVTSARALLAALLRDPKSTAVIAYLAPKFGDDALRVVESVLERESVPYLAAMRFTAAGWEKRGAWERCWALQRREDAGESVGAIEVPPKYDAKDYRDARWWSLRGRLDVARERFISYPGATTDDDASPLYGWAGWNHRERADALAALYQSRKLDAGWSGEPLVALLAGLNELVPWLLQWHNAPEDGAEQGSGEAYAAFVSEEGRELGVTREQLSQWGAGARSPRPRARARAR